MATHDLRKSGNYDINHVHLDLCGELELRHHTQKYIFTKTHTHQHIYVLHRPTLALELVALIRTDRAPRLAQTHQVGRTSHHSKP